MLEIAKKLNIDKKTQRKHQRVKSDVVCEEFLINNHNYFIINFIPSYYFLLFYRKFLVHKNMKIKGKELSTKHDLESLTSGVQLAIKSYNCNLIMCL